MYKRAILTLNDLKPLSVNSATVNSKQGRGRHSSQAANEFKYNVFNQLNNKDNYLVLKDLRESFIPTQHSFELSITTFYPHAEFVAASTGCISAKTVDCSNFEKPLVDLIFLPKYFDLEPPYGIRNLNLDDKFVTALHSYKKINPDGKHKITIEIKIVPRGF